MDGLSRTRFDYFWRNAGCFGTAPTRLARDLGLWLRYSPDPSERLTQHAAAFLVHSTVHGDQRVHVIPLCSCIIWFNSGGIARFACTARPPFQRRAHGHNACRHFLTYHCLICIRQRIADCVILCTLGIVSLARHHPSLWAI
jgi:hypothetical protein